MERRAWAKSWLRRWAGYTRDRKREARPAEPFLTISRQSGAGGNTLALLLLRAMQNHRDPSFWGWKHFDHEMFQRMHKKPSLKASFQSVFSHDLFRTGEKRLDIRLPDALQQMPPGTQLLFRNILSLAAQGKVILIGRGSSCLTRDMESGVHIRLVAPLATRIDTTRKLMDLTRHEASRFIRWQDSQRHSFVWRHFGWDINDPALYDAVWNTETVSMEDIAHQVLKLLGQKKAELGRPASTEPAFRGGEYHDDEQ